MGSATAFTFFRRSPRLFESGRSSRAVALRGNRTRNLVLISLEESARRHAKEMKWAGSHLQEAAVMTMPLELSLYGTPRELNPLPIGHHLSLRQLWRSPGKQPVAVYRFVNPCRIRWIGDSLSRMNILSTKIPTPSRERASGRHTWCTNQCDSTRLPSGDWQLSTLSF